MDGPESLAIRQAAAEVTFEKTHAERGDAWWGKAPLPPSDHVFERIQVWPSVLPAAAEQGVVMADHAGFYETSLLLAARPELVDMDRLGMGRALVLHHTRQQGAQGDRAEDGDRMWAAMVDAWVQELSALRRTRPAGTPRGDVVSEPRSQGRSLLESCGRAGTDDPYRTNSQSQ